MQDGGDRRHVLLQNLSVFYRQYFKNKKIYPDIIKFAHTIGNGCE